MRGTLLYCVDAGFTPATPSGDPNRALSYSLRLWHAGELTLRTAPPSAPLPINWPYAVPTCEADIASLRADGKLLYDACIGLCLGDRGVVPAEPLSAHGFARLITLLLCAPGSHFGAGLNTEPLPGDTGAGDYLPALAEAALRRAVRAIEAALPDCRPRRLALASAGRLGYPGTLEWHWSER